MTSPANRTADATLAPLTDVLDEQIRCAETILGLLDAEARALEAGDVDGLNAAGAEKTRLVDALDALERERRDLASAVAPAARAVLDKRWSQLLELVERMKSANQDNGARVEARRKEVLAALDLLHGADAALYDAAGERQSRQPGRTLGSA